MSTCKRFTTGFTLIELLVVITIIVVLLALLTPALDRAIYQAELVLCASQYKATGSAATVYAMEYKRNYPIRWDGYNGDPQTIRARANNRNPGGVKASGDQEPPFDVLHLLEGYTTWEAFVDPLAAGDIDLGDEANREDTLLMSTGQVFFGWGSNGRTEMKKLGNRHTFFDGERTYKYTALTTDRDGNTGYHDKNPGWVASTHPDSNGLMHPEVFQDENNSWGIQGAFQLTAAWWYDNVNASQRGTLDNNFGMADGSVIRYIDIELYDDRLGPTQDGIYWDFDQEGTHALIPQR